MHPVLKISEILRTILQVCDDDFRLPTASAIAITCRTFSEPGSDALWRDLPCLQPLLRCLPTNAVEKSGFHPIIAREAGRAQWARFLKHAARVRTLTLTADDFPRNERHMRVLFFMLPPEAPKIIPNVRTLKIAWESASQERYVDIDAGVAYLPLLLGPRTQTLKLRTKENIACQVLVQAALACPKLKQLELAGFAHVSTGILWHFAGLQHINLCNSSYKELIHPFDIASIAHLPSLRHLSLSVCYESRPILPDYDAGSGMFPALETLELRRITNIPAFSSLIKSISSSRMRKLQISIPGIEDFDDFYDVIQCFAKFLTLRCLSMTGYAERSRIFPTHLLGKLNALEKLTISLDIWHVPPDDVPDLGRACPRLRRLELLNDWDSHDPTIWPLNALSSLATHLPHLEHLRANVSAAVIPPPPTVRERAARVRTVVVGRHSLFSRKAGRDIDLWHPPLPSERWRGVASYISQVCPNARVAWDKSSSQSLGLSDRDRARFERFDWEPWKEVAREVDRLRRIAV